MEFFNKKQDVVDIQLTSYGKQLLSRGLFKPVYYAFSDDGVVYDSRWVTGSNADSQQSDIETRIQEETPRLKTQYRKVGAERGIFNAANASSVYSAVTNILELLEIYELTPESMFSMYEAVNEQHASNSTLEIGFSEAEKLLQNTLGDKSYQNSFDPAWNALFYNGEISGSTSYYQKNDIVSPKIPQLNCTLVDKCYRMALKYDPYEILSKPKRVIDGLNQRSNVLETGGETQLPNDNGLFFEKITGGTENFFKYLQAHLAGSGIDYSEQSINAFVQEKTPVIFVEKDFLFISLEEANVDFGSDNFMIEVYEVNTVDNNDHGEEQLTKMFFQNERPIGFLGESNSSVVQAIKNRSVEEVFHIEVDDEINSRLACYLLGQDKNLKKQSLYVDNVFNCEDISEQGGISIDPYTSLPDIDVGDVC